MFYFTCNESRIYESLTFWNKLWKKKLFHEIQIFWDAPVLYCFRRPIYAATLTRIAINPKIMKYT